jgi:hypothetical protein
VAILFAHLLLRPSAGVVCIMPGLFDFPFPLPLVFFAHTSHPKPLGRTSLIFVHTIADAAQKDYALSHVPRDANEVKILSKAIKLSN